MGIFSDEDINEAEKLIEEELKKKKELQAREDAEKEKKRIRLEFLEGFEEGWKKTKRSGKNSQEYQTIFELVRADKLLGYLSADINKNLKEFAYGFGLLVGIFKHHPMMVIDIATVQWFIKCVNILENKPSYHKFIEKRIKIWNKRIKSEWWPNINNGDKNRYLLFIKSV